MAIQSEVQYVAVAAAASNTTLVAAVAGKRIRVVSLALVATGGAITVKLQSTTATDLTGAMALAATTGSLVWQYNPAGWCQTVAGELLNLNCSATTAVGGVLGYVTAE